MNTPYQTSKSDLEKKEFIGKPPLLAYVVLGLLLLNAFSTIIINLLGAYDMEPIRIISSETLILVVTASFVLYWFFALIKKGSKQIYILLYIFCGITLISEGQNWMSSGIVLGLAEFLTFLNFVILLVALYISKLKLKGWFIN